MKAVEIKPNVFWVGAKDWNLRDFHGYTTHRGSSYNAFLIMDEKITLVDTVKSYLSQEMITRIRSIVDPAKIELIISNHTEMDHSGSIPEILKLAPKAQVLASANGEKGLKLHFDTSGWNLRAVAPGEKISLGQNTLQFFPIPLVHWPDSMATYLPEKKLLMPNDAFGQHIVAETLFDDEFDLEILLEEAAKYYANIVYPYAAQVEKALAALSPLDFDMIAPSHGLIWRKSLKTIVGKYQHWSSHGHSGRALIIYDTMWGSTETMAQTVKSAFEDAGVPVLLRSVKHSHISDIMTDVLEAKFIALGSPTLNNMVLPSMGALLTYIRGLKPQNKTGLAFGSYGWNPNALQDVEAMMRELGWTQPQPPITVKFRPNAETLANLKAAVLRWVESETTGKAQPAKQAGR